MQANFKTLTVAAVATLSFAAQSASAKECSAAKAAAAKPAATSVTTALAPVGDAESSRVISVVSSIALAVDLARYDLAETAFAPKVVIDYTSLWGGQPNTMTLAELAMQRAKAVTTASR
jgi:hypothetical protein